MSFDYESFVNSSGATHDPARFQKLKEDKDFSEYLARSVSKNLSNEDTEETIAQAILKKSGNDPTLAKNVAHKLKKIIGNIEDKKMAKVLKIIRANETLSPARIFAKKVEKQKGEDSSPSSTQYIRLIPKSIIAEEKKEALEPILANMVKYLSGDKDVKLEKPVADVLQFMEGNRGINELPITAENSQEYLTAIKLWDHAMALSNVTNNTHESFNTSSYELRTHIATIGNLPAHQVYTKTLDSQQYENWDFLEIQSNWIPERAQIHTKIVETNLVKALALSRRLNTDEPSVWAVRGNTGAGKTYSIGQDPEFSKALDENGEPSGAINPDTFKGALKRETPSLSHAQLHKEGSALSYQYAQALGKEAVNATLIIDTRLAKHSDLQTSVLNPTKVKNGNSMLLDIETPFITSINRVLTRSSDGDDPIVPLTAIKEGYELIRSERKRILEEVQTNQNIKYFKLYITDDTGTQKLALMKENGHYTVMPGMEEAVKKAMENPEENEMDKIVNQKIAEEYINLARKRDHISPEKITMIEQWKGYTVKEALEKHAKGEKPAGK